MDEKQTQRRFEVMGEDIFKIVNKISQDQQLLKLIKYLDNNPLSHEDLTEAEIDELIHKNILITPVIPDDDLMLENYLVVLLDSYAVDADNQDFKGTVIRFDIVCPIEKWVINQNSLRPYLMMNRIDQDFNEKKLAGIGNLQFMKAKRVVLSPYLAGYSLTYGHHEFN